MPKVLVEIEVSEDKLLELIGGQEEEETKPVRRGRRGATAKKDDDDDGEDKPARGRGSRASGNATKTAVKAIAAQVKSECPKGTLDEILDEFEVSSIDDLPRKDYQAFIDECNKDLNSK